MLGSAKAVFLEIVSKADTRALEKVPSPLKKLKSSNTIKQSVSAVNALALWTMPSCNDSSFILDENRYSNLLGLPSKLAISEMLLLGMIP